MPNRVSLRSLDYRKLYLSTNAIRDKLHLYLCLNTSVRILCKTTTIRRPIITAVKALPNLDQLSEFANY